MKVVELSGGVGGARMARGLMLATDVELTVVVNVGDDEVFHGLYVATDLDTVTYTLAGLEGDEGWGRQGDTFTVNTELARFGTDNRFQLGDFDLALHIYRGRRLGEGEALSTITADVTRSFGIGCDVIPATDDRLSTKVLVDDGWIGFQDYFVLRGAREEVRELRFEGSGSASPSPGVIEAIDTADLVVIGPSNPPLSIWPILAVTDIRDAVARHPRVVAISPLVRGRALKGPADRVMASLGLAPGNQGVIEAYDGLVDTLVIHSGDEPPDTHVRIVAMDTLIKSPRRATVFAEKVLRP